MAESSVIVQDGAAEGYIPATIRSDQISELQETFMVEIKDVELVDGPPKNLENLPKLGTRTVAKVHIAVNDDANGLFQITSVDPRVVDDGRMIMVEERDKFSVELTVERTGISTDR